VGDKIADTIKALEPKAPIVKRDVEVTGSVPKPKAPVKDLKRKMER
jgi:hypothetical protein